jgi:hypothetical protein
LLPRDRHNDMRELETSADPREEFAIDNFVYRVASIWRLPCKGWDSKTALPSAPGLLRRWHGPASRSTRPRMPGMPAKYRGPASRIPVYVPTDEELMMRNIRRGCL